MVNLTGNIEIGFIKLIFDFKKIGITEAEIWNNTLKKFQIPNQFLSVIKFFSPENSFSLQDEEFFILEKNF